MAIESWFPTQIYFERLFETPQDKFTTELADECYKIKDYDLEGQEWSKTNYPGGYTSFSSMSELHNFSSTFRELEENIYKHIVKYADSLEMDLGDGKLEMIDFWVNIMPALASHSSHIHPLSVISGTYYVQTPKSCSGIKFEDPRLAMFMGAPPKKPECSNKNRQFVKYDVAAGDLVLFESWLRHEVPASITDVDRISVSFNYGWA